MSQFSHFWSLFNKLPGRYEGFKEDLVLQFTGNRTSSMRAMRPGEYADMLKHVESLLQQHNSSRKVWSNVNLDQCRKRVIASICGYFTLTGREYNMKQVIGTACRSAQMPDFNSLTAEQLRKVYNTFRAKQQDCEKAIKRKTQSIGIINLN